MEELEDPKILYETPEYFLLYKPPFWSCTTNKDLSHYKEYPLHNNLIILYILFKLHNQRIFVKYIYVLQIIIF